VLKYVVSLVPFPVRSLRRHDLDPWRTGDRLMKPLQPGIASLMPRNTFQNRNLALAAQLLDDVFAAESSAVKVVGPDKGGHFASGICQRFAINAGVHDDDGYAGSIRLYDSRHDLFGPAGGYAQCSDLALDEVLDDLHLLFYIHFALGRL